MNKLVFYSLLMLSLCFSCTIETGFVNITDQCDFPEHFFSVCFYGSEYDKIDVRNNTDYRKFEDSIRIHPLNLDCDTASLPAIDFQDHMLIGKSTSGGGCFADYDRKVFIDHDNRKIIYEIRVNYYGTCEMLITNRNIAIIPKQPKNYTVEFIIK